MEASIVIIVLINLLIAGVLSSEIDINFFGFFVLLNDQLLWKLHWFHQPILFKEFKVYASLHFLSCVRQMNKISRIFQIYICLENSHVIKFLSFLLILPFVSSFLLFSFSPRIFMTTVIIASKQKCRKKNCSFKMWTPESKVQEKESDLI